MRLALQNKVLVAGGAGFVGSNLVEYLLGQDKEVFCVDNLSTGTEQNVSSFEKVSKFHWINGDICDHKVMGLLQKCRFTEIYNLACPTGVPNIAVLGEEMLLTSAEGSLNLLRLASAMGAKYLFTSTAEVYGNPGVFPQAESYTGNVDPVGPRSPYEEGKRYAEALTLNFAKRHNLDARIIRVFNTYGTRMSLLDTRVIPSMLSSIAVGDQVTIYGDGENTRAFLYVSDLVDAFTRVMELQMSGEVFNVGGGREVSINELFLTCSKVTGHNSKPAYKPHFIEDHSRRLPDTSKIRALGWSPAVSIEDGLSLSFADVRLRVELKNDPALKPSSSDRHHHTVLPTVSLN